MRPSRLREPRYYVTEIILLTTPETQNGYHSSGIVGGRCSQRTKLCSIMRSKKLPLRTPGYASSYSFEVTYRVLRWRRYLLGLYPPWLGSFRIRNLPSLLESIETARYQRQNWSE